VVVFGSARIPAPEAAGARARRRGCVLDPERTYAAAREFARLVSRAGQIHGPMPILLFDERYWRRIVNFDAMVEEGVISLQDRDLVRYVKSAESAWRAICAHYGIDPALADEGS
jgi:predicted Rossmann-fold nucleotide-binding protein